MSLKSARLTTIAPGQIASREALNTTTVKLLSEIKEYMSKSETRFTNLEEEITNLKKGKVASI